ncbi:hypothetical protein EIKCOROL_02020 [Eikenella corrodens ATCC 23834]|uniref:Uncharacterized protein n=1 Tax=Eikenella corrodens ATCC 23834 TaxID=546274 RepID=C0DXB4_EIKCO|nr:hypothetical protein EIKCOROL_02020 [Eikenella corrodens ATCC 23834]
MKQLICKRLPENVSGSLLLGMEKGSGFDLNQCGVCCMPHAFFGSLLGSDLSLIY